MVNHVRQAWKHSYVSLHDPQCDKKELATVLLSEVYQTTDQQSGLPFDYSHYSQE